MLRSSQWIHLQQGTGVQSGRKVQQGTVGAGFRRMCILVDAVLHLNSSLVFLCEVCPEHLDTIPVSAATPIIPASGS